jgi:hypothetical protein
VVGNRGLVLQVKSRSHPSGDSAREHRWVTKHVGKGLRQANGSIRVLAREPRRMTNARGRTIEVPSHQCRWVAVVIVDHGSIPDGIRVATDGEQNPSAVLSRRDWEFLWQQLKSTSAVAQYLERIAGETHELGMEALRYYDLAQADQETARAPTSIQILGGPGFRMRSPLLPLAPAGVGEPTPHLLVRAILEDLANAITDVPEPDRLRYLAMVSIPGLRPGLRP